MGALARIDDLSFTFQSASSPQLHHINLTVHDADFLVLAGLTGSGKTTLLHQLMPSIALAGTRTGHVELFGKPDDESIRSSLIGYVPQRPREILVAGTLREELAIRLRGMESDGQLQASDIVGFLGLSHLLDTNLANLSEGQAQLVALASVLATRPQLLLLDEPTASLDSVTRRQTVDLLRRLNEDHGMTIVMAEHNLQDLLGIATRLVVLENGIIRADATPANAIRHIWQSGESALLPLVPTVPLYFLLREQHYPQLHTDELPITVSQGIRELREQSSVTFADTNDVTFADENNVTVADNNDVTFADAEDVTFAEKDSANVTFANVTSSSSAKVTSPTSANVTPAKVTSSANVTSQSTVPALRVSEVTYGYPNLPHNAVQDVNLDAYYGETLALIGQSGSGKSTLLQLLYGLTTPQFGTVSWKSPNSGRLSLRRSARRFNTNISYLPQDVRPLLALEAGSHVHEADVHDDPLDYSVGQQQMRALRIVLDQERPVLLLDEPTQGLDATARQWVGEQLRKAQERGALVIFSSHDPDFVATWATRAMVLLAGQVVAQGSPREIVSQLEYSTTAIHRLLRRTNPHILTREDVCGLYEQ